MKSIAELKKETLAFLSQEKIRDLMRLFNEQKGITYLDEIKPRELHKKTDSALDILLDRYKEQSPDSFSFYFHLPFCTTSPYNGVERSCVMCDYYKVEDGDTKQLDEYVTAVLRELDIIQEFVSGKFNTLSLGFGGGTPTRLSDVQLENLLSGIHERIRVNEGAEVTIEATPESVNLERLVRLRNMGFNRVSIGVQTFDDATLQLLNRRHTSAQGYQALVDLHKAGFDKTCADLMYGLPSQTIDSWIKDIEQIVSVHPWSVSMYRLRMPSNHFLLQENQAPTREQVNYMYVFARLFFLDRGYLQVAGNQFITDYERGMCLHKENRDRHLNTVGIGASSHSFIREIFYHNYRTVPAYIHAVETGELPIEKITTLSTDEEQRYCLKLGLRLSGDRINPGLNKADYRRRYETGIDTDLKEKLQFLRGLGIINENQTNIWLNRVGMVFQKEIEQYIMSK